MDKSIKFSLNKRDILKSIPALLSGILWFYLSNTEVINNIFIKMWTDPALLVAILPFITYIWALFIKGK